MKFVRTDFTHSLKAYRRTNRDRGPSARHRRIRSMGGRIPAREER